MALKSCHPAVGVTINVTSQGEFYTRKNQGSAKTIPWIFTKFGGRIRYVPRKNPLKFRADMDKRKEISTQ